MDDEPFDEVIKRLACDHATSWVAHLKEQHGLQDEKNELIPLLLDDVEVLLADVIARTKQDVVQELSQIVDDIRRKSAEQIERALEFWLLRNARAKGEN